MIHSNCPNPGTVKVAWCFENKARKKCLEKTFLCNGFHCLLTDFNVHDDLNFSLCTYIHTLMLTPLRTSNFLRYFSKTEYELGEGAVATRYFWNGSHAIAL